MDCEDLCPLNGKELVLAYLSDDPQCKVRDVLGKYSRMAGGEDSLYYHLQVQRLLMAKDPEERFWHLWPYFGDTRNPDRITTRDGILSCGTAAGSALRDYFRDSRGVFRIEILRVWHVLGYREATPLLTELLQQHGQFWTGEHLQRGWWDETANPEQTGRRRETCAEDLEVVRVLRSFNDARAREALTATRAWWTAAASDPLGIAKECEAALRELGP